MLLLFIVGDILGTGIYALTGQVAAEIGEAAWLPLLLAFAVATVTASSDSCYRAYSSASGSATR